MPEKPVARLQLDTRAHGPYTCETCDDDSLEDALLMTDASVVCPECKTPLKEFQDHFSDWVVSAAPIAQPKRTSGGREKWIIEWTDVDSSRDATVAYNSREEAFEAAIDWIKECVDNELESVDWDESDEDDKEQVDMLRKMLDDIKNGRHREVIIAWLDYQREVDWDEQMAIGPSGNVSKSSGDFAYMTK